MPGQPSHRLSRSLFLRLVGLVLLVAFVSLWVQIEGLVGSRGLLPLDQHLAHAGEALGAHAWWRLPTLFWLADGDGALHAVCASGVVVSLLLMAGVAPLPMLALGWLLYLSLTVAGQTFTSFQWDILLLESCFTALFVAHGGRWPRWPQHDPEPSRVGLWLVRLLLFKLMFLSGAVKLLSMDETWWRLTALDMHYYTQPLPPWTAWYAHQLPRAFQRASVLVMFLIEIVLPFAIFFGRRARALAAAGIVFLMIMIALTGNYTFFNLLTAVLCIPLLDDRMLGRLLPERLRTALAGAASSREAATPGAGAGPRALRALRAFAASGLILLSALTFVRELVRTVPVREPDKALGRLVAAADRGVLSWGNAILRHTDPFHTVSGYGLFRSMTTRRPEIVIEGSADGTVWREYGFVWKPGDVGRRPGFAQPHQPRLDWQMWFAALGPVRQRHWLEPLLLRLLEGEPAVTGLLGDNPFADEPPRFVRLVYYDYVFTDVAERKRSGRWWERTFTGLLTPQPVSLESLRNRS